MILDNAIDRDFSFKIYDIFGFLKAKHLLEKITKQVIQDLIHKNEIELSSTHRKLCIPIINRIYKKMVAGIKFSAIKVDKNLICDGHHRYLASLLADFSIERFPTISTSATTSIDWKAVVFEDMDWDTQAKINMLNEQDAIYNNMTIEQILDILK